MFKQGGAEHSGDCTQRSYPLVPEAGPDQPCVPAGSDSISLLCLPRARLLQVFTGSSWVFPKLSCCRPSIFPLPCMTDSADSIHIEASFYHTSVSWLVEFRKPLCGTAPSVIPIQWGNNATFGRCALLALFLFFLSPCFSLLLTGADMSSFFLGLKESEMYSRFQKTDRIWFENSSITDELAMSAEITLSEIHRTFRDFQRFTELATLSAVFGFMYNTQQQTLFAAFGIGQLLWNYTMAEYEHKSHWSTTPQPSISSSTPHFSYSEPLHYDSTQPIQTSALQISQTQTP